MQETLNILTKYQGYIDLFNPRGKQFTTAFGVLAPEKLVLAASNPAGFTLYVTNDYVVAQTAYRQLNAIKGGFVYIPFFDDVLLNKKSLTNSTQYALSDALAKICSGSCCGAVAVVDALNQLLPSKESFAKSILTFKVGDNFAFQTLAQTLTDRGFVRVDSVSAVGEFAIRGDIVDIYSPCHPQPVRISFFDDTIESMKYFGEELVSVAEADSVTVYNLAILPTDKALNSINFRADKAKLDANGRTRLNTVISQVECDGGRWLLPFVEHSFLADYLPALTTVVWDEPKLIGDKLKRICSDHEMRFDRLLAAGEVLPEHFKQMASWDETVSLYQHFRQLAVQQMPYSTPFFAPQSLTQFKTTPLYNYRYNIAQLATDINQWIRNGYDLLLFAGEIDTAERISRQLRENGASVAVETDGVFNAKEGAILPYGVERGFVSHTNKLAVIGVKDLVHKATQSRLSKTKKQAFLTPVVGEYVVHELHGIGLCEGIQTIKGSWGVKDFIVVKYRNDDRLYVPIEASNLLSRFSGSDTTPTLSKIGGADFERVKASVKKSIKEMSIDLLRLYASRENKRGHVYKIDTYLCNEFDASFEYVETPDQLKSIAEIDADLVKDKIMDRLLVGDVGFGKTEVALRTAFKVIANGYQVALMAPTTILSEQHYETALKRMSSFNIKVGCLNRFRSTAEQNEIIAKTEKGEIDLLVGTHKLLGKNVKFSKLGLLVLDEEQRFGVEHKEKLKDIKKNIDVLTLSATPIPRTLHMALTGMRDISTITTPPTERIPIETFVVEESDELLRDIIIREISRQGQVYLVYNRVETIDFFASRLRQLVPEADFVVAHGQMSSTLLEKSIYDFSKGRHDVLICTTIIENGIDIPNANTLIVYEADNLGLSQLYQLRGRVGRSDKQAYAYMVYKENKILSEVAFKRLTSIMENTELGSGFKIAMADLEIRGAGNVLGREQHGFMQKVGYEMYSKLLAEAVAEIKGQPIPEALAFDTNVDVDIDAYAPDTYIPDKEARMAFYQKVAGVSSKTEKEELVAELNDVYGSVPTSVSNLLEIVTVKYLSHKCGINNVVVSKGNARLEFVDKDKLFRGDVFDAVSKYSPKVRLDSKVLALNIDGDDTVQTLKSLEQFLAEIG